MSQTENDTDGAESILPEADIEGFIKWVVNDYSDERWSAVYQRDNSVTVWSGKYPAFSRFQKDIRPELHKRGLTISETRTNVPKTIDDEMERVHWISAIPIVQTVAEAHGMTCSRMTCNRLIKSHGAEYCSECHSIFAEVDQ